jgi:hypothetical protein
VVDGTEVVAIFTRDDSKLVLRMARIWIQLGRQTIVSLCGAPIALLVFLDQLSLAVA